MFFFYLYKYINSTYTENIYIYISRYIHIRQQKEKEFISNQSGRKNKSILSYYSILFFWEIHKEDLRSLLAIEP